MEYKVLKPFRDKLTGKRYKTGDNYKLNDKERADSGVKRGLLKPTKNVDKQEKEIVHVGGGWYELPNGDKVKGKETAEAQLKAGE